MDEQIWHRYKWPGSVKKSVDDAYPNEPLFKILDKTAEKSGNLVFTIFEGVETTYVQALSSANRIANFLVQKGIKKGDRVAIFMPNMPHYPIIFFGILKAGATAVTCNPLYKAPELNFQLKDSGVKAIFCFDHEHFTPICYEAVKGTEVKDVVVCSAKNFLPKFKAVIGRLIGKVPKSPYYEEEITSFYDEIIANYEPETPELDINPEEDLALILYTGGTTGTPKGAMLTHKNLYYNLVQQDEWIQLVTEEGGHPQKAVYGEEVLIGALPWYHSYGLSLTMLAAVYKAQKLIPIPDPRAGKYPLSVILEAIHKYGGTVLHAVPSMYAGIANHPEVKKYDLTSIKSCGSGAAPLAPEVAKSFEAVTGAALYEGYGLTETSPMTHGNPTRKELRKFGTVGLPIPDTYVKIVDLETGTKEMATGETGEIALSGPQVMKGYWNKIEETAAVFREIDGKRFFLTGDIGHLDGEGFTVITDRKKDMINVSGLKAYPREIEDILYEHPKVKLAAAVGLPREDDPSSEYVKAYLVLKEGETATEKEIIEWCRDRMAGYKRPKEVEIRDDLPMTPVGKVLRRVLQDEEKQKTITH
ncbi:MAG: long-chain fatty acid--CoA ligase [Candidatus Odinarchaeota archaeon]